jgi:membrane protease YdiL (CAAX protease family)
MGYGKVVQVVFSGLFFALAHVYGFTSPGAFLITEAYTFLLGVALVIAYLLGQRSLTPSIVGHALTDMIIEPALLLFFFTR